MFCKQLLSFIHSLISWITETTFFSSRKLHLILCHFITFTNQLLHINTFQPAWIGNASLLGCGLAPRGPRLVKGLPDLFLQSPDGPSHSRKASPGLPGGRTESAWSPSEQLFDSHEPGPSYVSFICSGIPRCIVNWPSEGFIHLVNFLSLCFVYLQNPCSVGPQKTIYWHLWEFCKVWAATLGDWCLACIWCFQKNKK